MINNLINRLGTPVPLPDRILEIVAGVMVIALLVTTAILHSMSPDTIPTHLSFSGEADDFSDKSFYWLTSVMFTLFMLINFISAYYTDKNSVRLQIRRKEMSPRQIMLAARVCRITNVALAIIWLDVLLSMSADWLQISSASVIAMNIVSVSLLIIPSIWYGIKIMNS